MNIVSARIEMGVGVTGGSMAVAPVITKTISNTPFYESEWWLGYVAVAGAILLTVSAINALIRLRRNINGDGDPKK